MASIITIVAALVMLLLGLVGYLRGVRRGIVAIAGTLLGASLVDFWAETWGSSLAQRFSATDSGTLTLMSSNLAFLLTVFLVGYGGGLLLAQSKEAQQPSQRIAATLLGVLNGALIIGYMLHFATADHAGFREVVRESPLGRLLNDGLPLLFLLVAAGVAAMVLAVGGMRVAANLRAQRSVPSMAGAARQPEPARAAPAATAPLHVPPAERPPNSAEADRKVLETINRRMSG